MTIETVNVPDIGGADSVEVIEISVNVGDRVELEQSLITLESDKASMEVPSPLAGEVTELHLEVGASVSKGDAIVDIEVEVETQSEESTQSAVAKQAGEATATDAIEPKPEASAAEPSSASAGTTDVPRIAAAVSAEHQWGGAVHAGPAVRKLARELGVDLSLIKGSAAHDRVTEADVRTFIKSALRPEGLASAASPTTMPTIDFTQFGAVDQQSLSKLHKLTAQNMQRSWLNVPHVTHFDDADITDLEDYRASLKPMMEQRGVKLSPLPFIVKACALALRSHPEFNASLLSDGEHIAYKQFYHIGLAVDTAAGLMVPVLRDVDRKSIWEIAKEILELSSKANDRKLAAAEMQGACFTVSSLGNMGGKGFTPIVNTPEVGILGVSRTAIKPVYIDAKFVPRKMLPLSLSYDHRAVNGAHAGKFMTDLCALLADIRRQLL